jgi:hypothetical protein
MIEVDTEDLATLSINHFKEFDTGAYYRENYRCFYKLIGSDEETARTDAQFAYRIKDYYSATATNNTIICKVVRDGASYEAEISLAFTSKGANGTGYTIAVSPATAQAALTPANTSDNPWNLHIRIYNNENKLITDAIELTTSLLMPSKRVILKNDSDNMKFADGVYTLPVYY